MPTCPECGYREEASRDWFQFAGPGSALIVCPDCDSLLGGGISNPL